jgi:RNase P subunit RPR2
MILMFIQQVCSKCKGILIPTEEKERVEVIEAGDMEIEFVGYDTFKCVCCGHEEERRVF